MTPPGQPEEAKAGEARDMRLLSDGQILGMTISLGDTEDHTFCDDDVAQLLSHAHAQRDAIAALTRKVAEDEALLREAEWQGGKDSTEPQCPICRRSMTKPCTVLVDGSWETVPGGHAPDCKLAARLRDSRAGGGEAT